MPAHRMFNPRKPALVVRGMAGNPNDAPEILLYGEIGWDVRGTDVVRALAQLASEPEVHVRINSPGGNVFEGLVIANAIRGFRGKIVAHIDAVAASAASIIAIAATEVRMANNAFFMIHEPFTFAGGTADDFRSIADTLDKMLGNFVAEYERKSEQPEKQIRAWLKDETWFTAPEALEAGFVDALEDVTDADAAFDLSVFDNAPEQLKRMAASGDEPKTPTVRTIERALRDAGLSRAKARQMASVVVQGEQDDPRDADDRDLLALIGQVTDNIRSSTTTP